MRLVIGGPARDTGPVSFAYDLARLYARTREDGPWSWVEMDFKPATYVHVGREAVLAEAIQWQATHVLWLDTDMHFPPDTAIRLAKHNQSIVASNCVMRDPRLLPTAMRDGRRIATTQASSGIESVDFVGFGVLLMRTDVVASLPQPWFEHGRNTAGDDVGEDVMLCRKLRAAGRNIYIDHDLSKEVKHIGQCAYGMWPEVVHV